MAWFKKNREKAVINFIDLDNDLMSIGNSVEITGKTGEVVEYDPHEAIDDLEGKGYVLVKNQYNPGGQNPQFTDDTEVYLISFKHGLRPVNPKHPLTKIDSDKYVHPINFTVKFENTPTKVKDIKQTVNLYRTLTADKITNKQVPNGKFDTDWKLEKDKFDDVTLPVLPGGHTNKKVIPGPAVGDKDIEVVAHYEPNGYLIPVDENGDEIEGVGPYQFANDPDDPTKVAENQIVPDINGYTHDQETISPKDPGKDMPVLYKREAGDAPVEQVEDTLPKLAPSQEENKPSQPAQDTDEVPEPKMHDEEETPLPETGIERREDEQMAIINFIDLDNKGKQVTSSGPLFGLPGETINNLYSTEVPLRAIEKAGFDVVFNNFDGDGQTQKFNSNHLLTQIFTVGLRHKNSSSASLDQVRQKIQNYTPSVQDGAESKAVISVANATMELIKMFIDKNQKQEAAQNKPAKSDTDKAEDQEA